MMSIAVSTVRRIWVGIGLAVLVSASLQCSAEQGTCESQCTSSRWSGVEGCSEACIRACACGFIPSPLGSTGEHFMEVCAQSNEDVRAQVTECFDVAKATDGDERWCGEGEPVCPTIETCLLEEFDASVVGSVRIEIEFYDGDVELDRCAGGLVCDAPASEEPVVPVPMAVPGIDACSTSGEETEGETQEPTGTTGMIVTNVPVHPCAQDGVQLVHVMAVRDQTVLPLFDLECGFEEAAGRPRLATDVPAGDFQYVARIRGLGTDGKPLCLTSRVDCVGENGHSVTVRFGVDFRSTTWQCEDDIASCTDEDDNDHDGVANCDDADCAPFCKELGEAACRNGIDDDDDGTTDCSDFECRDVCELSTGACGDELDNDGDGDVDQYDTGCDEHYERGAEECGNGRDDDHDCKVDCEDEGCEDFCSVDTSGTGSTGA